MKLNDMVIGRVYNYGWSDQGIYLGPEKVETDSSYVYRQRKTTTKAKMVKIIVAVWDEKGEPLPAGQHRICVQDDHPELVMPGQIDSEYAESREAAIERLHADQARQNAHQATRHTSAIEAEGLAEEVNQLLRNLDFSGFAIGSVDDDNNPRLRIEINDAKRFTSLFVDRMLGINVRRTDGS